VSRRTAGRVAWALWAVVVTGLVFLLAVLPLLDPRNRTGIEIPLTFAFTAFVLGFATVGALVASRHPTNAVGWVMCATGLAFLTGGVSGSFSEYAAHTGSLVGADRYVAWLSLWTWGLGAGLPITFGLLLFPDGRLPSPRWKIVAWSAGIGLAVLVPGIAFVPGPMTDIGVTNPFGIRALEDLLEVAAGAGGVLFAVSAFCSMASLVFRFRAAGAEQRQQLKWLSYAVAVVAIAAASSIVLETAGAGDENLINLSNLLVTSSLAAIPVTIGIAVLKYRLYDIDRIINRTLLYSAVTAFLAAVYYGVVVFLQGVAGDRFADSSFAVAGSTLAVAALFRPARTRLQDVIDRRFNRRRYDVQQTVEGFGARLRDEIDLRTLEGDLLAVVSETMQPAHASLWLRPNQSRLEPGGAP
jgi:hypothetical protein